MILGGAKFTVCADYMVHTNLHGSHYLDSQKLFGFQTKQKFVMPWNGATKICE
jgi:hypothetical protein